MSESPLKLLSTFGQSPWLDFIRRDLLESGELDRMIAMWELRGVTSNPVIFHKAIVETQEYDLDIARLAREGNSAVQIYERLAIDDVRAAADKLRGVYAASDGVDGYVSLEVSPHLARDGGGTIAAAKRLWWMLDRPNVMLKVPGTREGLTAVQRLLADGINVNVTLLFSMEQYHGTIDAYCSGLEAALDDGRRVEHIASVASFFLSRLDSLVDHELDRIAAQGGACGAQAAALRGEIAIAAARLAYDVFKATIKSERFRRLAAHGVRPQRLLWASTGTKDPTYKDLKYVEPLIGPQTVNTMPLATLRAYHDHGRPALRLEEDPERAARTIAALADVGVYFSGVTDRLLEEGIEKFVQPYDALLAALEDARGRALSNTAG